MSWPTHPKSKPIIKIIEESEMNIFGDEVDLWSPSKSYDNLLMNRINHLLKQIGKKNKMDKDIFEKVKIIAENVGISFWNEELESETSEENLEHSDENLEKSEN